MINSSSEMRIGELHTLRVTFVPGRLSFLLLREGHPISQTNYFPAYTKVALWRYLTYTLVRDLRRCGGTTRQLASVVRLARAYGPWEFPHYDFPTAGFTAGPKDFGFNTELDVV